nr:hypothetical protein [uncultured Actinotalea sp.]
MGHTRARHVAGLALATFLLVGCAADAGGPAGPATPAPTPPSPEQTEPTVTLTPEPERTATPPSSVGATAADAVADLAERLGVEPGEVAVVRDVAVTWPDGSLGCPAPGMAYTQALTPGRLVVLEAAGTTVEYHSGGRRGLFLCENPQPPVETETDR